MQDTKRYAALQNTFFERAAAPVTRRETLWSVLLGASVLGFPLAWGGLGSRALSLPISKGPQGPGEAGPKGKK